MYAYHKYVKSFTRETWKKSTKNNRSSNFQNFSGLPSHQPESGSRE